MPGINEFKPRVVEAEIINIGEPDPGIEREREVVLERD
jgi:hypothetical protein